MGIIRKLMWQWYLFYIRVYDRHLWKHGSSGEFEFCRNLLCRAVQPFDRYYVEHWDKYNRVMHGGSKEV